MKHSVLFFLATLLFIFLPSVAQAKASSPAVSISYIRTKSAARIYVGNIRGVSKVSYTLVYDGNGMTQGVLGNFSPGKKTTYSKDIYLGTCSSKICTPQRNIKNIRLEVVCKYTNGSSSKKTYKVK
jgi:hypothetical protein